MSRRTYGLVAGWLLLAVIATVPFWLTDLDLQVAGAFYHPGGPDASLSASWPAGEAPLPQTLYTIGSAIAWLAVLLTVIVFLHPGMAKRESWRRISLILLATVAIGPGLLVNGLGKDFTGRPRPRDLVEFGGQFDYLAPWQLGTPGVGKSFPCGHCSVGFALGAVGIALAQARPLIGSGIVFGSLLLGAGIGFARIAAGAHFLSDVIWAALLSLGPGAIIARSRWRIFVETDRASLPRWIKWGAPATVALGIVSGLVFARPFHELIRVSPDSGHDIETYILDMGMAKPIIEMDESMDGPLKIIGEIRGFGFPNVEVHSDSRLAGNSWHYRLKVSGWTSEIETPIRVVMNPAFKSRIHIVTAQTQHAKENAPID